MSTGNEERRKESRVNVRFLAIVSWIGVDGQEITENASTFSISGGGAGLMTGQLIPVGKKVRVTLDVGGLVGSSWAEAKWAMADEDRFKIGISFRSN